MSQIKTEEEKELEVGAAQLLGLIPYPEPQPKVECQHEDDGYVYDETARYYVLRCYKCGEFYEERK